MIQIIFHSKNFDSLRNDPNYESVCTNLSPYINYGQISFQRLALEVRALKKHSNGTAAFIEEGVVRRELSDNFVYYTPDGYDSLDGAADWARDSLELHASDEREYLYTWKELERGETHDDLWNAGQMQLVREGGLHGFVSTWFVIASLWYHRELIQNSYAHSLKMRMYWAKKILEWTPSPSYALATAQYFNDRFAYDGNDPNGFVGVGWSIMGIHDMGWKERPIFGKIRYMNYAGCKRKFKIDPFVARYKGAKENAAKALAAKGGDAKVSGKKRKA
jgi:deoxyribodipyrimidine photo-lyase